jgi:hypothetical protein
MWRNSMSSVSRRRLAAVAIMSMVSLLAVSADASAKSSRAKSRSAAMGQAMQAAGATGMMSGAAGYMSGGSQPTYTYRPQGGALDNTAGWGNVGAR